MFAAPFFAICLEPFCGFLHDGQIRARNVDDRADAGNGVSMDVLTVLSLCRGTMLEIQVM
jgi:hypothetical protein